MRGTSISIPTLVRIKRGAISRLGIYCARNDFKKVAVVYSADMISPLTHALESSLGEAGITPVLRSPVTAASFDEARKILAALPSDASAIIGFGGGKALDVAKFTAALARLPYIATPTSLSNDSFASPGVSLLLDGKKRSLRGVMPYGVVIDIDVCLGAPLPLWHSGIGDLSAKITAVRDWKLAFHAVGEPVDDFASLLSDASVHQFISRPAHDAEGVRLLGTALMLNGIAMEVCGSSRPASGSEHLISHALDCVAATPSLHGIQVGVATYIVSHLQGVATEKIAHLFEVTGFWDTVYKTPMVRQEWLEAVRRAPEVKPGYYTVLSERDCVPQVRDLMERDERLRSCFSAEAHRWVPAKGEEQ
jgi:glycerol-1-phosphate dehydrogenase [NAD(P)+]